jgi:transposase
VRATTTDDALAELATAADEAARARAARDALIVAAVRGGISRRAVARATGMTHAGVNRMVIRAERSPVAGRRRPTGAEAK